MEQVRVPIDELEAISPTNSILKPMASDQPDWQ
jgi:hypothetical protein